MEYSYASIFHKVCTIGSASKEDGSVLPEGKPLPVLPHGQGSLYFAVGLALLCCMSLPSPTPNIMYPLPRIATCFVYRWWKGWVSTLLEFLGAPKDSGHSSEYSETRAPSTQDRCWQLYPDETAFGNYPKGFLVSSLLCAESC